MQNLIYSYNNSNIYLALPGKILMRLTWSVFATDKETADSMNCTVEKVDEIIPERSLMSD